MDTTIPISAINDFLFCPKSLYLHSIYIPFEKSMYHDTPQTKGKISHATIDDHSYTTSKYILQGLSVYSEKIQVKGIIDIYDSKNKYLIERKYKIKYIYDGYKYQLYAQMFCMQEMSYEIRRLFLHSLSDNKRYEVPLPDEIERMKFESVVSHIKSFNSHSINLHSCSRCANNIYGLLNW